MEVIAYFKFDQYFNSTDSSKYLSTILTQTSTSNSSKLELSCYTTNSNKYSNNAPSRANSICITIQINIPLVLHPIE